MVIALCVASLIYQYFSREDAYPVSSLAFSAIVPFQQGVNSIGGFLFDRETARMELSEAKQRIEELEEENRLLKIREDRNQDLIRENEDLRALVRAKERLSDYEMLEASVIGSENADIFRRFTIDRGTLDGIAVNMNVINGDGLIGYISQAGLNYSVVTCITEDDISVSAMTRNGKKHCIVTGDLELSREGMLKMENAPVTVDLGTDQTLVTSNISDKYLPGLLIGYVTEYEKDLGELTQSGKVRCAVDFTDIREVLVITSQKEKKED